MKLKDSYPNIFSYPDPDVKATFLKDGLALMAGVGKKLKLRGGTVKSHQNRAGIAVSGEVSADVTLPGYAFSLHVQIGASCTGSWPGFREDGVYILIQKGQGSFTQNIWRDANLTSDQLAHELVLIFEGGQ